MSELKNEDQISNIKYDTEFYDDEYMEWISKNYNTPIEILKQMTNEELSAFLKNAFTKEKEEKKIKEINAFKEVKKIHPSFSFEEILGGVILDGHELDDGYWNLFCAVMELLPSDSRSNKGRTISEFWTDSLAVAKLYDEMYGWVDQDLEGFGLIGNLNVSLRPARDYQTSGYRFESFDFEKPLKDFEKKYMVL